MNEEEIAEFEENPSYADAVRVRIWDDMGKDPDMQTASLDHFLDHIDACIKA